MRTTRKTQRLLAFTGLSLLVLGTGAHATGGGTIEGTWINRVQIVACPPAPPTVIATFESMTTILRGGTLIEGGAPATPPPAVSRSAGHGVWKRLDHRAFVLWFRSHSFDSLGRLVRITEVTSYPRLFRGDDPDTPDVVEPYYMSGEGSNTITNLNPVDGSVVSVTQGCNVATSRPVLIEH